MKRKHKINKEIRVGIFILGAITIIISTVFFIGGQKNLFGGKVKYKILFQSTGGLYTGDPVLLTGVEVGNVTRMGFPDDVKEKKILVEISVLKEVAPRIRRDTRARIAAASLVYGKNVELSMGSFSEPEIPSDGYIQADEKSTYSAIVDSTQMMVDDIRRVLLKLDRGEGAAGMLINEPMEMRETLHNLSVASNNLASILIRLNQGRGPLGTMLSDSIEFNQSIEDVKQISADFRDMTQKMKNNRTVAGKLFYDETYGDAMMQDLHSTIRSLASITAKIDSGQGALGSLINDKELYYGLQDVVLGVRKSSIAKWLIQNRRKAGEKERKKQEVLVKAQEE